MKILFYSVNSLDNIPNLASELDLMQTHLDAGDEVTVLRCTGQLTYCNVNPSHWRSKCFLCQQSLSRGLDALRPGKNNQLPTIVDLSQLLRGSTPDFSLLPERFEDLASLMAYQIDDVNLGAATVSSVVSKTKEHKLDTEVYQQEIHNSLKAAYIVYCAAREALERIKPDKVYFFNGRLAETRPFLQVCKQMNIPSLTIERAGDFGRYNLFENTMAIDINYIKAEIQRIWHASTESEEKKREVGEAWFHAKRQGILTGDKYYGQNQMDEMLPKGFDTSNRNIAVFTTSEYEFAGISEWQNPVYHDQNEAIVKIAYSLQESRFSNYQLWIRVHPNLRNRKCTQLDDLREIEAMRFPNLHIIWPDSPVNSYAFMEKSDVIVTFGSTIGVEATFWNKPSILAGRSLYEDINCCYRPRSHEELIDFLEKDLLVLPKHGALQYGYRMMRNGMPYRYFKQTGYYEGDFQGETFQRIPKTWLGKAYYLWLRKLDKLQNGRKSKKRVAPKPSIKKTQSFQNDFKGAGCP